MGGGRRYLIDHRAGREAVDLHDAGDDTYINICIYTYIYIFVCIYVYTNIYIYIYNMYSGLRPRHLIDHRAGREAVDLHDACELFHLVLPGENRVPCVQLRENARERPANHTHIPPRVTNRRCRARFSGYVEALGTGQKAVDLHDAGELLHLVPPRENRLPCVQLRENARERPADAYSVRTTTLQKCAAVPRRTRI